MNTSLRSLKNTGLVILALISLSCDLKADPTPSTPQSREWREEYPDIIIENTDTYIDYKRDGQTVLRTIARLRSITAKRNHKNVKGQQNIVEFVANGKVFASIVLGTALDWNVTSGVAVHISSGIADPDGKKRFFHVCVPKYNYYEYLEINGTDVAFTIGDTPEAYAKQKQGFIRMTERGYVGDLDDAKMQ